MSGEAGELGETQPIRAPEAVQVPTSTAVSHPPQGSGHGNGHHHLEFRFLDELKRRNVGRVAILYLVVCWLILEPVHVIFHMLEVPVWANRLVIILMTLGFPVALIFAWVYELTPDGLKPAAEVDPHNSIRAQTGQRLNRAIIVVLALALSYFVVDKFWLSKRLATEHEGASAVAESPASAPAVPPISDKSIAVLPFVDMSEKKDQEYFADGLADELLDVLTRIPGLRVIGRTSSLQFKGKGDDLRSIGAKLGAAHIMEGSVRRAGDHIRITAQLIRSVDGAHEWSGTYDRDVRDLLQVQTEISASVARALEVSVSDFQQQEHAMADPEAYDLYLRGLHALDRYSRDGIEEALNYLGRAVERDPQYLRAYEMLAVTHVVQVDAKYVPAEPGWARVHSDALELLKRNPASDVGHAILCQRATSYTWNWNEAERECAAALASPRRSVGGDYETALLALARGEYAQSVQHFRSVFTSDPLYADAHVEISQPLLRLGRLSEAESEVRRGLEISPTFLFGHFNLGTVLMAEGRLKEAQHELEHEAPEGGQQAGLAVVYFALGRGTDSQAALGRFVRDYGADHPFNVAEIYAYVGDADHAFEWLERAYQQRDNWLRYLKGNWKLRRIERDSRYRAFLRKMNLPE